MQNKYPYQFTFGLTQTLCYYLSSFHELQFNVAQLDNSVCEAFYNLSVKICELEALTFQTEENKKLLDELKVEFNKLVDNLSSFNSNLPLIEYKEWRFIAGMFCCFMEWCENTCYFKLSKEKQEFIWSENPLISLGEFN